MVILLILFYHKLVVQPYATAVPYERVDLRFNDAVRVPTVNPQDPAILINHNYDPQGMWIMINLFKLIFTIPINICSHENTVFVFKNVT